jgi:hypothetical protein
MAEWSNAAVLKTVVRSRGPGVRIPLSPQNINHTALLRGFLFVLVPTKACFEEGLKQIKNARSV